MQDNVARPRGLQTLHPVLSHSFVACLAVVIVSSYGLVLGARRIINADHFQLTSYESSGRLEEARSNVRNAVSSMRAYMLSGSQLQQQQCLEMIDNARRNLSEFQEVSGQRTTSAQIQALLDNVSASITQALDSRTESAISNAKLSEDVALDQSIRNLEEGFASELMSQSKVISSYREKRQDDFLLTEFAFLALMLGGAGSLFLAGFSLRRESSHRKLAEAQHASTKQDLLTVQAMLELSDEKDDLTGLLNREAFEKILTQEYDKSRKNKFALTLVIVHMDQLLQIREAKGVTVFAEALKTTANLLKESFRGGDIVCRYDQAEFAIILPRTNLSNATIAAERSRTLIERTPWTDCNITASFGVAQADFQKEVSELISRTEQAVDYARRTGRNRVTAIRAFLPLSA